jgi:hypothetical protein
MSVGVMEDYKLRYLRASHTLGVISTQLIFTKGFEGNLTSPSCIILLSDCH